jgi:hypothetical protein
MEIREENIKKEWTKHICQILKKCNIEKGIITSAIPEQKRAYFELLTQLNDNIKYIDYDDTFFYQSFPMEYNKKRQLYSKIYSMDDIKDEEEKRKISDLINFNIIDVKADFAIYYEDGIENFRLKKLEDNNDNKLKYLQEMENPDRFMAIIRKALYYYKYIIIPCFLAFKSGGHAAMIIINKMNKEIIYFDPWGSTGKANEYFENILNKLIPLLNEYHIQDINHENQSERQYILDLLELSPGKDEQQILNKMLQKIDIKYQNQVKNAQLKSYQLIINKLKIQQNLGICAYYTFIYAYLYTYKKYQHDVIIKIMQDPDVFIQLREFLELIYPYKYKFSNRLFGGKSCFQQERPRFDESLNLNLFSNIEYLQCFFEHKRPFIIVNHNTYKSYKHENNIKLPHKTICLQPFIENPLYLIYHTKYQPVIDKIVNIRPKHSLNDVYNDFLKRINKLKNELILKSEFKKQNELIQLEEEFNNFQQFKEHIQKNPIALNDIKTIEEITQNLPKNINNLLYEEIFNIKLLLDRLQIYIEYADNIPIDENILIQTENAIGILEATINGLYNAVTSHKLLINHIQKMCSNLRKQLIRKKEYPNEISYNLTPYDNIITLKHPFILGFLMGFRSTGYLKEELPDVKFNHDAEEELKYNPDANQLPNKNIQILAEPTEYKQLIDMFKNNSPDLRYFIGIDMFDGNPTNHLHERYKLAMGPKIINCAPFSEIKDAKVNLQYFSHLLNMIDKNIYNLNVLDRFVEKIGGEESPADTLQNASFLAFPLILCNFTKSKVIYFGFILIIVICFIILLYYIINNRKYSFKSSNR